MRDRNRLLSVNDSYDAAVDYLESLYANTKSEQIMSIVSGMPLLANGKSVDPAMLQDWNHAVDKFLDQKNNMRQQFELTNQKFTIEDAYEVMINFLETYNYFSEIEAMAGGMRSAIDGLPTDTKAWITWTKSVNKILNQKPRVRPLFFGINTKILSTDKASDTMSNFLDKCYHETTLPDFKLLLEDIQPLTNEKYADNKTSLDVKQAYEIMIDSLDKYGRKIKSTEIVDIAKKMRLPDDIFSHTCPEFWNLWLESVNETLDFF